MNIYLAGASLAAALAYGLVLSRRPPSIMRMAIKTAAVGLLAVIALVAGAPWMLFLALGFSALGDAFMAEPERFLPAGLTSFLVAHLLYTPLFLAFGNLALLAEPVRAAGVGLTILLAIGLMRWLWPELGKLRPAVVAYVVAITAMVSTSFLLPSAMWPAIAGAVAFMASDAILAGELFRKARLFGSQRLTDWAVWFLYYGGQALIAYAILEACCSRQVI